MHKTLKSVKTLALLNVIPLAAAAVAHAVPTTPAAKKPQRRQAIMYHQGKLPVLAEFKATLKSDRAEYVLGENVLVHFRVENTGDKPFTIHHGGDYRGAPRQTRFIVTATPVDAAAAGGKDAPDPYPIINHFGGLGGEQVLKPGEQFEQSLALMHYVHILAAGEYVVQVSHDLGWVPPIDGSHAAIAEMRVRFTMPDEREAKRVVEAMQALPPRDAVAGKRDADYSDFSVMRYAIYLPLLEERLNYDTGVDEQHRVGRQSLKAIEYMPDPVALRTLLRLADGKTGPAAGRIAAALTHHLPAAASDKRYGPPERFPADFSWRDEFAGDVRKLAQRLLDMNESTENVAWGAALLKQVGRAEDMPAVVAALDRVIPELTRTPYNDGIFSRTRNTMSSLQAAVGDLLPRGAKPPDDPKTPGEIVAYLAAIPPDLTGLPGAPANAAKPPPPPPELAERVAAWSAHPAAYVREMSLNAARLPLSDALRKRLPALIEEEDDVNVRLAASRLAQRAKETSCAAAVLQRIKSAPTYWEIDQHADTALQVGAAVDSWYALAARLHEEKLFFNLLRHLCDVAEHSGGFGWRNDVSLVEMKRVKARWQEFLKEHDAELRAGKRFKIGDPQFTPDLFPPGFNFNTSKGDWPPPKAQ